MAEVRPMREGDEAEAEAAWDTAFSAMREAHHLPNFPRTHDLIENGQRRMRYLRTTDPGGSWVAEADGRIIGVAQAHVRSGIWVLATLAVVPQHQDERIGQQLLNQSVGYGDGQNRGAIFSSPDPRAVQRYVKAGFDLHPAVSAQGPVRVAVDEPEGVHEGTADDLDEVDLVDQTVRGAARRGDVAFQLELGHRLLLDPEGGYVVMRGGRVAMLSALDERVATRLLLAAFARCPPGESVDVNWITPEQQWAIKVAAGAGVSLHFHGAVMMRGDWQPEQPYLANGIFG